MFERWFALDPGSDTFRFYDYTSGRQSGIKAVYGLDNHKISAVGREALDYAQKEKPRFQIRYPMEKDDISALEPLIKAGMDSLDARRYFFRPCFLVALDGKTPENIKEQWTQLLLSFGARKVEFIDPIQFLITEGSSMIVHVGHSHTRLALVIDEQVIQSMCLDYGAKTIASNVAKMITSKYKCLVSDQTAMELVIKASGLLKNRKNGSLQCEAMNYCGAFETVTLKAMEIWECMKAVFEQITAWCACLLDSVAADQRAEILHGGIQLSGGLASCFGLEGMLHVFFECPVEISEDSSHIIIEHMKGWK